MIYFASSFVITSIIMVFTMKSKRFNYRLWSKVEKKVPRAFHVFMYIILFVTLIMIADSVIQVQEDAIRSIIQGIVMGIASGFRPSYIDQISEYPY